MNTARMMLIPLIIAIGPIASSSTLEQWLPSEINKSAYALYANISPAGTLAGTVIASPSQSNPNYYYHWVRDASIVMDTMVSAYITAQDKSPYYAMLMDFAALSRRQQLTPNMSGEPGDTGLGEPKFNVDGSAFNEAWGRPQNDSAASRASTLIHFANALIQNGQMSIVQQYLYSAQLPANTVIKADLEYVAHHWADLSFDLWEEVKGDHFYTNMVQRRALLEGAAFANQMNDAAAASFYQQQAQAIAMQLQSYWDARDGIILPTLNQQNNPGCGPKTSGLDVAVVLGSIAGCAGDGYFCPGDDTVTSTANKIQQSFAALYPINRVTIDSNSGEALGTAIGRYPDDCFNGTGSAGPAGAWFLATNAFAELDYQMARNAQNAGYLDLSATKMQYFKRNVIGSRLSMRAGERVLRGDARFAVLLNDLKTAGDNQLRRTKYHSGPDGALSEQMNRDSGFMQSAHDLSWSYASLLTAVWAR